MTTKGENAPAAMSAEDLREIESGIGRITLVLKSGREINGAAIMGHIRHLEAKVKAFGTPEGNALRFSLAKKLAIHAVREWWAKDPECTAYPEMERRLLEVKTPAEFDTLVRDECEDDWLEGYILGRMEELVNEVCDPSSHHQPPTWSPKEEKAAAKAVIGAFNLPGIPFNRE